MSRRFILKIAAAMGLLALPAHADTVQFAVDPSLIGVVHRGTEIDLFSPDLNGTLLEGQSLSLDLLLADEVLVRSYLGHSGLGLSLTVYTNAMTFPGFAGLTTGFLLDPVGNPRGNTHDAGRSMGNNGTFSIGLQLTPSSLGLAGPGDISGVHFDTSFPDTEGLMVSDLRLRFSPRSQSRLRFGTAQQLPEPPAWMLLLTGVLGVLAAQRRAA